MAPARKLMGVTPVLNELVRVLGHAGPLTAGFLLQNAGALAVVFSAAHYMGMTDLAGVAVGNAIVSLTCSAVVTGFSAGMSVAILDVFDDPPRAGQVGILLQQGLALLVASLILPLIILWLGCPLWLGWLRFEPFVTDCIRRYLMWRLVTVIISPTRELLMAWTQAKRVQTPSLLGSLSCFLVHILGACFIVPRSGIMGAAMVQNVGELTGLLVFIGGILSRGMHLHIDPLRSLDKLFVSWAEAFALLRFCMGKSAFFWVQWCLPELYILLVGDLGFLSITTQGVLQTLQSLIPLVVGGISVTSCSRMAWLVEEGFVELAGALGWSLILLHIPIALFVAVLFSHCRWWFATHLAGNFLVEFELVDTLPVFALFAFWEVMQFCVGHGIVRSIPQYKRSGTYVCLVAHGFIGLPTAYFCAYNKDMGLRGIWYGTMAGSAVMMALNMFLFLRADWQALSPWSTPDLDNLEL